MACSDRGRGRRSMPEKTFNSRIADIAINSNIGKELGKGGLRVKARRQQERPQVLGACQWIRMLSPNLQEKCHGIVDIAGHRRQLPKVTRWQENNLVAGSEDARHQWLVDKRAFRAIPLDKGVTIPTEGHESVHSRLYSLEYRKHDASIVRRTFTCTGIKVASGVPSEGCISCDLNQHDS